MPEPWVADPDEVIEHRPAACSGCGTALSADAATAGFTTTQVFDLPEPKLVVTEHRMLTVCCSCGARTTAPRPAGVAGAPCCYGPGVNALAVYARVFQHLPSDRTTALGADAAGAAFSEGFADAALERAATALAPFADHATALLQNAPVAHFDESGIRAAARLSWVHVASTQYLTWYVAHGRRGKEGMEAAGVLPYFTGTTVTDAWGPYLAFKGIGARALCGQHLLRDLHAVADAAPDTQGWATAAADALTNANNACHAARTAGEQTLPPETIAELQAAFDRAVRCGRSANPDPPPGGKKTFARQLVDRLTRRHDDVLRFLHDLTVPFTNNQAEQDLRIVKAQMKISGGWRTLKGANRWLLVRSFLSTARKHGHNPLQALRHLFTGTVWLPPAHA